MSSQIPIVFLVVALSLVSIPRGISGRYCKCFANGSMPGLLAFTQQTTAFSSFSPAGSTQCYNGYCTPAAGSGCFRAVIYQGQFGGGFGFQPFFQVYQFCGPQVVPGSPSTPFLSGIGGVQQVQQIAASWSQSQAGQFQQGSLASLGQCQQQNFQTPGICYCDNADYCNSANLAKTFGLLMLFSVCALLLLH